MPLVDSPVEVLVLGPLAVRVDGADVDLVGAMPRRLLALLAARSGSDVPADALVEELWQGRPPAGASATLQSHVARLRRALGSAEAVRTRPGGYRLAARVDADAFEAAAREGRGEEPAERADRLRDALGAWRGPAYDGLRDAAGLALEGQRLDELRLTTTVACVALEQSLGRTGGHVQELEDLVRRHPVSEPLWGLLVRALYADGRQSDALAAYQRARLALRDELGVEPGDALRRVEHQVLTHDPALLPTAGVARDESGQRRTVTVLAFDVPEPVTDDGEPETAAATAQRLALARVIEEHGGTLLRSPGLTTFAVFGSPVGHDDDAARALRARDTLLEQWPDTQAGLATGLVATDADGEPRPGPVTQRAERLARGSGPGRHRMDEATRSAVLSAGQPGVDPTFVGRTGDLATLRHLLASTISTGGPSWPRWSPRPGWGSHGSAQSSSAART